MFFLEMLLSAVSLSMDALAASLGIGACLGTAAGGGAADMFPLAIVLSFEDYGRWRKMRLDLGAKSDKEALLGLLEVRGA